MKTVKTFFLVFPALNSTAMIKKLKYSNSYLIVAQIHRQIRPPWIFVCNIRAKKGNIEREKKKVKQKQKIFPENRIHIELEVETLAAS